MDDSFVEVNFTRVIKRFYLDGRRHAGPLPELFPAEPIILCPLKQETREERVEIWEVKRPDGSAFYTRANNVIDEAIIQGNLVTRLTGTRQIPDYGNEVVRGWVHPQSIYDVILKEEKENWINVVGFRPKEKP